MMFNQRHPAAALPRRWAVALAILLATLPARCQPPARAASGELELSVHDARTQEPTAVRIDLRDARGRPLRVPGLPWIGRQSVFDGQVVLKLRPGSYTFRLEKGPEYRVRTGQFVIESGAADHHEVQMQQYVDMSGEGWWSGDLQLQTPLRQTPLFMLAEDLDFAPLLTVQPRRAGDLGQPEGERRR